MSTSCDETLAEHALKMAVARRHPKAGFLQHSDRGCQYTSRAYRQQLEQVGAVVSRTRKGMCWDNAAGQWDALGAAQSLADHRERFCCLRAKDGEESAQYSAGSANAGGAQTSPHPPERAASCARGRLGGSRMDLCELTGKT